MTRERRPLTWAQREDVFRIATRSLPARYAAAIARGMTDDELTAALVATFGTFGGSCGPDRLHVIHQGSGLKIWGGWHVVNHVTEPPLFSGSATLAMARYLYGISNPGDPQMPLF